jgi:hypothetical protein
LTTGQVVFYDVGGSGHMGRVNEQVVIRLLDVVFGLFRTVFHPPQKHFYDRKDSIF